MKEHYYLDNASTTWPKPPEVYAAMDRVMRTVGVSPGRGHYALSFEADQLVHETRDLLARFFNHPGGPDRVVFTQNATDALNMALFGILAEGDHVVSTRLEHNSVLRPLFHLRDALCVDVTLVPFDSEGYVAPDDVRRALTNRTRAVVVNHASNVLGSIQDLAAIGTVARDAGACFVVDASQTAGVVDVDVDALGIDLLAFPGHKTLFGPMGIGGLLVGPRVDVAPRRFGGTGIDSRSPRQPDDYPYRLEAGTLPLPAIAGLNAAQKWFIEIGRQTCASGDALSHRQACRHAVEHVGRTVRRHRAQLEHAFRNMDGVVVYGPTSGQLTVSTLSINIPGTDAEQLADVLDAEYHVCVRAGYHCAPLVHEDLRTIATRGTLRISPGFFGDAEDIEHAIQGVNELAATATHHADAARGVAASLRP